MLPASWKPAQAGGLVRLGPPNDGGYLVSKRAVTDSKLLLSMGVSDEWQFEADFRRLSGARVVCFDHSINLRFWLLYSLKNLVRLRLVRATKYLGYLLFFSQRGVEHRLIKIGHDTPGCSTLRSLLEEFGDSRIFLKVDIEGSEYRLLNDILGGVDRLTGIVIEFHDVDIHRERVDEFIGRLHGFTIVDIHANNHGGMDDNGDPLVLELTMIRDDLVDRDLSDETVHLSGPNNPKLPDIALNFEPA